MVSFVLVTVLTAISLAGGWVPFPVDLSAETQEKPDVYGNKIVWQQYVQGDWDIYGVELSDAGDIFFIVAEWPSTDQLNASIWENKVVWQDDYSGTWAIYMADTTDPENIWDTEVPVASIQDVNHEYPAISGNTVVWQEFNESSQSIDIWGTDVTEIDNILHYEVAGLDLNQQRPAIYRDNVFWQDDQYGLWDILQADFWQKDFPEIYDLLYDDSVDQENPSVWGDIVAWDENIGGDIQIIAADISDPDFPVKFSVCLDGSLQQNPDVCDNLIVWEDFRNGNWDIYGYNLTTHQEFQVTTDPADQINPAVSGDLVAWQEDIGDGEYNIYAAYLFGPEVAKCTSKLAADINKDCQVNIKDLAMLASQWLLCNLDSTELCLY